MKYEVVIKQCVNGIVYEHYEVNAANEEEAFENCVVTFFDEILVDSIPNIDEIIKQTKEYFNQILTFDK